MWINLAIIITVSLHGAMSCTGWSKGDNPVPEFWGLIKDDVISVPASKKLEYQFGNKDFRNLWKIALTSDMPDWLSFNQSSAIVYGTPRKQDIGQTTIQVAIQSLLEQLPCEQSMTVNLTVDVTGSSAGRKGDCGSGPVLLTPVDEVKAIVGRPVIIPVCHVFQASQDLTLSLTLPYGEMVGENFWLRLDKSTESLYGVPLKDDVPSPNAVSLVAVDDCGNKVKDSMRMTLKWPSLSSEISHTFNMTFDSALSDIFSSRQDLSSFLTDWLHHLELWLEMSDMVYILNTYPSPPSIIWTLMDESNTVCDEPFLSSVLNKVIQPDDLIQPNFQCFMGPLYPVSSLSLNVTKKCSYNLPILAYQAKRSNYKSSFDHWLEVVLPCAVFVLIVTIVVVTLMICSNRYPGMRKKYVLRSEEHTYLEERKPVIFPNEGQVKDTTLGPRSPVMLSEATGDDNGSTPSLIIRGTSHPPDYHIEDVGVPPPYRLPPPYHSSHPDW